MSFHFRIHSDSVLTWVDVSNCAKQYADDAGKEILDKQWNNASYRFNKYMEAKDKKNSFAMLEQANQAFADVAPHINNEPLKQYFLDTNKNFGAKLAAGDLKAINQYMIDVHDEFKKKVQGE